MRPHRTRAFHARRFIPIAAGLILSLLSCGREVTGPDGAALRFARGLSFDTQYPASITEFAALSEGVVDFDRVRVLFTRSDESVALDRTVPFPAGAASVQPSFDIAIAPDAPSSGELMQLTLFYITAAGDTIFRAGPQSVLVVPSRSGDTAPAPIPVVPLYVGIGADAAMLEMFPDTIEVLAGTAFTFTAIARAANKSPLAGTPVAFRTLDPTRATITAPNAGTGLAQSLRGYALVVAQTLSGQADTGVVHVLPRLASLSAVSGQGLSVPGGSTVAVTVRAVATDGQAMIAVPLSLAVSSGGGSLSLASTVTDAAGEATFSWTLGGAAGAQTATVSSAGIADLVINATSTFAGATQLVITQQPGATHTAGATVAPAFIVEARTAANATYAPYTGTVTLALGATASGAVLAGTVEATAVAGIATFSDWRVALAGSGYTVVASATGLTSATSSAFAITPASASALVLSSGGGQIGEPGAALPAPIVVRVNDAFGNGVAGSVVTFAASAGSPSPAVDTTDAAGLASTTWTLGTSAGAQTLTATAAGGVTGLMGSPVSVTATAAGAIVSTTVTPSTTTITSIGGTFTLSAAARDAAANVVPTTFTWVSRTPGVATVSAAGLVTSVANGSTYVVATAVGGTVDSAQVIVAQQLATIVVTPANADVYLGASRSFTAQAVDGLGVALGVQPGITWSSQASAIASVTAGGVATGVGLGSTQIRATAGAVTGLSTLTVRTPITRIAILRDSLTFVTNDTFTLDALGRTRSYRAVAYDTLDAVMTGVAFVWVSSNPSVALLDSSSVLTGRAWARANGFTNIRATAQGVTGSAALTVQQVMTSIDLRLSTSMIAVFGNSVANPRRLDANGFPLPPGGTFTYASADPGIATVSATGVVTGVLAGATTITAISGAINSNAATISVSNSVPPIISFGRDTLTIGRSATNQGVPIYLSRPDTVPITISVVVEQDSAAYFSAATITIPAGSTVGTALLNGRSARATQVFAADGSGRGYAGDTAVLVVQASVSLQSGSYNLVVNDQLTTQVRLTDPSDGGTYVTYTYGTPGRVMISPDPAFIPNGQLSADIVLRATAAGGTSVTPAAAGVNGTSSTVGTTAAALVMAYPTYRLGAGQMVQNLYTYTSANLFSPLPLIFTPGDSTIVQRSPATSSIAAGSSYAYFNVIGVAPGTATVTASATGFTPATTTATVTTPMVTISGGGTYNTTAPDIGVTVYVADSTRNANARVNSLNVQLRSSNPAVIEVVTPEVTISAGQYYSSAGRVRPGGVGDTAWVYAEASGHVIDSTRFVVVGPKLEFSFTTARLGAGQYDQNHYVYTPNNVLTPLTVTLVRSDAAVLGLPETVTIPAGSNYVYFSPAGLVPGQSSVIAQAAGFRPDTALVTVTTPRITNAWGSTPSLTINNFAAPSQITTYTTDSVGTAHYRTAPLIITYTSSNPAAVTVTGADTVLAGAYVTSNARITPVSPDTATITASAPGHGSTSWFYTVLAPQLQFSTATYRIGRRQFRQPTDFYVYTPNQRAVEVPVTITQSRPDLDSLTTTSPTIPTTRNYEYFSLAGLGTGVDMLIASAVGYRPDTMIVTITTPRLIVGGIGNGTTTSPIATTTVYTADSVGNFHYSLDSLLVRARSSNNAAIQPEFEAIWIPRSQYNAPMRYRYVGPGTASITVSDSLGILYGPDTTNVATVTGPSLTFYNGRPVLGMRQNGAGTSAYVSIPNALATPLTINIVSTDPAVASAPATVTIPVGLTYAYVAIAAGDQTGTVQIQATATGYTSAVTTQQVTTPRFTVSVSGSTYTTSQPSTITVYAADANNTAHYTNEAVSVTLVSSNIAAATIDSTVVVIPAGGYYNGNARLIPGEAGTMTITASDARADSYRYQPDSANVAVNMPALQLSWGATPVSLGIGQWIDPYVYTPNTMASLTVALTHSTAASTSPASATITTSNYSYFRLTGAVAGNDTITASAPGHIDGRSPVIVGLGRVDGFSGWPAQLAAATDSVLVTMYARAPDGNVRSVSAATTFTVASSSGNIQVVSGGANSSPITTVTIPADATSVSFYVKYASAGSGTMTFTNANYQPFTTPSVTTP